MIRKRKHRRYCRLSEKLQAKEYQYMKTVEAAKSCISERDKKIAAYRRMVGQLHGIAGLCINEIGGSLELTDQELAGISAYSVIVHPVPDKQVTQFFAHKEMQ